MKKLTKGRMHVGTWLGTLGLLASALAVLPTGSASASPEDLADRVSPALDRRAALVESQNLAGSEDLPAPAGPGVSTQSYTCPKAGKGDCYNDGSQGYWDCRYRWVQTAEYGDDERHEYRYEYTCVYHPAGKTPNQRAWDA